MNNYTDVLNNIKPDSSDEEFINSILKRNKKRRAANIRALCITAFAAVGLMAATITVGATNDWDYPALFKSVFGNNPVVINSMGKDINYEVVNNTFDGLTFEVSAIYADSDSLFITVDITSEKSLFNESHNGELGGCIGPLRLGDGFQGWPEFTMNSFSYHVLDEYRMVAAAYFSVPIDRETFPIFGDHVPGYLEGVVHYKEVVAAGSYFTILFDGGGSLSGFPVSGGRAEVRFIVDAIDDKNVLFLYPDMTLDNSVLIKEIRINPFSFTIRYDDNTASLVSENHGNRICILDAVDVSLLLKDGSRKPLQMLHYGGTIRTGFGDERDESDIWWSELLHYDQLLVIDDIAAVLFGDLEIPVN